MSVYTTLIKSLRPVPSLSGPLSDQGQLRAYSNNGKVVYFRTLRVDAAVQTKGYGYTSRSKQLVKRLSLI